MAFTKIDGRTQLDSFVATITYEDMTSGTALEIAEMPFNAIVVGGFVNVKTAWDSSVSDALDVGDDTDADEYIAALNLQATGLTELTQTGYEYTSVEDMIATWTGSGDAPTQGELDLVCFYIRRGKVEFTEG